MAERADREQIKSLAESSKTTAEALRTPGLSAIADKQLSHRLAEQVVDHLLGEGHRLSEAAVLALRGINGRCNTAEGPEIGRDGVQGC